jgi:predicted PurR-regulated permease PerM
VTEAFILGGLCFVGMTVFSFPYALMTASLMTVTALIPVFGAWIGAAGGALMIITASPSKAIWFLIFIVILQQLENNLIYPRVVGKSVGLPALWVFLSVAVGSSLLGIVGMLAGVPIASVIYCLFTKKSLEYRVYARVGENDNENAPSENASEESQIM